MEKARAAKLWSRIHILNGEWRMSLGLLRRGAGETADEVVTRIETTGTPASIRLAADRASIFADGEDVSVITVTAHDEQGREVPIADNLIQFDLSGAGKIIGVGNGDPSSHEADKYLNGKYQRRLFNGKCQVIVQAIRQAGVIELKATSVRLRAATLQIKAEASQARPSVN